MNLVTLAQTALTIQGLGNIGIIDGMLHLGMQRLRQPQREAIPLHTLAVSVAASIVRGNFVSENYLQPLDGFKKNPELFRDAEQYVFFRGIRIGHMDEVNGHGGLEGLLDKVNNLLAHGIVINSDTVRRPLFEDTPVSAPWQAAVATLGNFWKRESDGAILADFHDGEGHFSLINVPGTPLATVSHSSVYDTVKCVRGMGFEVVDNFIDSYAKLEETMNQLGMTPARFNTLMAKDYLS